MDTSFRILDTLAINRAFNVSKHGPLRGKATEKYPVAPPTPAPAESSIMWASPFAPSNTAAWPDSRSKANWVGPFDLRRDHRAKTATFDTTPEPSNLQELRKLAEIHQKRRQYTEARFCWASIVDQYISEKEHISRWTGDYSAQYDKISSFEHRIEASVGGVLNTYIVQFPDLGHFADNYETCFYRLVEREKSYEHPLVLYTTRILLSYCLRIPFRSDREWLYRVYRQVLSIAEPVFGPQHPEIIHLVKDMAAVAETQLEAEDLLQRALSVLQQLHGPTNPSSLDCVHELANLYQRARKTPEAESILRETYETVTSNLGDEHDETMRLLARLSSILVETKSEEAGLLVYPFIAKHHKTMSETSLDSLMEWELRVTEKYTPNRGWGEMLMLNKKLSRHLAPFHFGWADPCLYILPIHEVMLLPASPSEAEKDQAWSFRAKSGSKDGDPMQEFYAMPDFTALKFKSFVRNDAALDLQVPYIPYTHFLDTKSCQNKEPYLEYVKAPEDHRISSLIYEEATANTPIKVSNIGLCEEPLSSTGEYDTQGIDSRSYLILNYETSTTLSVAQGFFNGIPTDSALLYSEEEEPAYNLVSSKWADWQHFTLHSLSEDLHLTQLLKNTDIKCRGYISGTWTEHDLTISRMTCKLLVVDAVFRASASKDASTHLFALSTEALSLSPSYSLTGPDKRAFCARLNPSLYQVDIRLVLRPCAVFERKMKGGNVKSVAEDENDLWAEMNRREEWDRDFERRKPENQADRDTLKRALGEEDEQRALWDRRFQKLASAQSIPPMGDDQHEGPASDNGEANLASSTCESSDAGVAVLGAKTRFKRGFDKLRYLF